MSQIIEIGRPFRDLNGLNFLFTGSKKLKLSKAASKRIQKSRKYLEDKLKESNQVFYGINTGFGSLCDVRISQKNLDQLQRNLILSHACGTGDEVPSEIVRLMMFLKIANMSKGYSAVRPKLVNKMVEHYNKGIVPVVYQLGSLGASGDLAPLAHLSLPLIGEGEVYFQGKRMSAASALNKSSTNTIKLREKEGIALLNGTQFSLAYGVWSASHAMRLLQWSNAISAMSADAYQCSYDPYKAEIHDVRNQLGQQKVASDLRKWLRGSAIGRIKKTTVQDPYSFRCIPQVHGASADAFSHVNQIFVREMNAVTDNPNVFADQDSILSGGNFHAQPLALSLDFLAIALSELGSISERRLFKLINGDRGLPQFLSPNPGLNSGMMILQYTAASIVSQNKQLCTPASVDSITSSRGQEDHVSMAANAATKCHRVVNNLYRILSMELIASSQAMEFRRPHQSSSRIERVHSSFRKTVSAMKEDRLLYKDMEKAESFVRGFEL